MKPDLTTFIAACPADIRSHFQEQTYSFQDKLMEQNKKSLSQKEAFYIK